MFHFQRNDFKNWIKTAVGDDVLAERINHISRQLPVEDVRKELVKTVQTRISQLMLLHGEMIFPNNKHSPNVIGREPAIRFKPNAFTSDI